MNLVIPSESIPRKDAVAVGQQQAVNAQVATHSKPSVGLAFSWIGKSDLISKFHYHTFKKNFNLLIEKSLNSKFFTFKANPFLPFYL